MIHETKEKAVRRSLSALLVSLVTLAALPAPSAGAVEVAHPHPPHPVVRAHLTRPDPLTRTLIHEASARRLSLPGLLAAWQHVAVCEVNGDWSMVGPTYSGIGFSNATWSQYGGGRYAPLAGEATRFQQIVVGMRVTGGWIPDQDGCDPGGW